MTVALRKATHARHYAEAPQVIEADGTKHWITRAANFVTVVSVVKQGARLARDNHPDEYMVFLPEVGATISAGAEKIDAVGNSLTIVPPGNSEVLATKDATIVSVFSNKASDITAKAMNATTYADGAPEIAPIVNWPDPVGGFKLRHYKLAEIDSPDTSALKMRVFRSTNLMINIFMPWTKRRDEGKLSPHFHTDFEQISLGVKGSFIHHLRYPWGPDKASWVEDEHEHFDSPSVLVIPAYVLHTTQDFGDGTTWLVDVFGPPRHDFSSRPGFVLNERDYPVPAQA